MPAWQLAAVVSLSWISGGLFWAALFWDSRGLALRDRPAAAGLRWRLPVAWLWTIFGLALLWAVAVLIEALSTTSAWSIARSTAWVR